MCINLQISSKGLIISRALYNSRAFHQVAPDPGPGGGGGGWWQHTVGPPAPAAQFLRGRRLGALARQLACKGSCACTFQLCCRPRWSASQARHHQPQTRRGRASGGVYGAHRWQWPRQRRRRSQPWRMRRRRPAVVPPRRAQATQGGALPQPWLSVLLLLLLLLLLLHSRRRRSSSFSALPPPTPTVCGRSRN
eukprot:SAG25_NODE_24_length_22161_cov_23.692405_22_plen_193_part_00